MNIAIIIFRAIGFVIFLPFAFLAIVSYGLHDSIVYWNERFNGKREHVCPWCNGTGRIMLHPTVGEGA